MWLNKGLYQKNEKIKQNDHWGFSVKVKILQI